MVTIRRRGRLGCKDDEGGRLCTTEGEGGDYIYKSYMGYRPGRVTGRVAGAK